MSFSKLHRFWLRPLVFKLLPFGVKGLQVLEGIDPDIFGLQTKLQNAQTLYREISFFWNETSFDGISAKTHIVIVNYFIVVLLTLMASRYFAWFLLNNFYLIMLQAFFRGGS